ncbi:MAG TPA: DUF4034 domain-containing protein [Thermohalobaculum sp.]|nr:DUF4034 domain-containing protein [Thermohalobaculum sp.]
MRFFKGVYRFFRSILLACLVMLPVYVFGTLYMNRDYLSREGVMMWWTYLTRGPAPAAAVPDDWGHGTIPPVNADLLAIPALLRAGDHMALDSLFRRDREVFWSFSESAPDLAEPLDAWVKAQPLSAAAHLTRGKYWHTIGAHRRGSAYASRTTATQFAEMHNAYGRAERDYLAARALAPRLGQAYAGLLAIYNSTGRDRELAETWAAAVAEGAVSTRLYFYLINSMKPWWSRMSGTESVAAVRALLEELETGSLKGTGELERLRAYPGYIEAEVLWRAGRRDAALARYGEIVEGTQGLAHLDNYASRLSSAGRDAEALPIYAARLRYAPEDGGTAARYGGALVRLQLYDEAREAFDRALQIDSHDPGTLARRATLHSSLERYREALADYERAKVYGSERASNWAGAGRMRLRLREELPEAAANYRRAIELKPDREAYHYNFAAVLDRMQDCRAIPVYLSYLQLCREKGECDAYSVNWVTVRSNSLVDRLICSIDGHRLDPGAWLPVGDG